MILDSTIRLLYWCAIFCTFFLSYIKIGVFPPSNYIAVLLIYILIIKIFASRKNIFKNDQLIFFTFLISLIISLTMVLSGDSISDIIFRLAKSMGTGLILSMASFAVVYTYGFKSAIKPMFLFGTLTSIVAIMQAMDFDFAWSLRESMGYANDWAVEEQITKRFRVPGMAFYSNTLSYQLLVVFALVMIGIKNNTNFLIKKNLINIAAIIIIAIAILLTGGRSAYPVILLLFYIIFTSSIGLYRYFLVFLVVGSILSLFVFNNDLLDRLLNAGIGGRVNSWLNGFQLLLIEPFGIGEDTSNFAKIILSEDFNRSGSVQYPHFHLITAGVKFGLFPVIIYIIYNITLIIRVNLTLKKTRSIVILSIIIYQFNTMFHNAGMLLGEQNGWYMFGIIEALLAIEKRRMKYKLNAIGDN